MDTSRRTAARSRAVRARLVLLASLVVLTKGHVADRDDDEDGCGGLGAVATL